MPRQMTEQERQEFLAEPRGAVLSVAGGDRPPHRSGTPTRLVETSPSLPGPRAESPGSRASSGGRAR